MRWIKLRLLEALIVSYNKNKNEFLCVLGGITAYNMSPGKFFVTNKWKSRNVLIISFIYDLCVVEEFHPVGRIIQHHLTADEKQLLMDRIRASVRGTTPLDIGALIFALQNNAMIADLMLQTVKEFLVQAKGYMEWKQHIISSTFTT